MLSPLDHAAIHYPDAIAFAVTAFHGSDNVFDSCDISRVSCENFVAEWHSTARDHQSDANLLAVAALIPGIASLRQRKIGSTLEVRARHVVQQQVVFELK